MESLRPEAFGANIPMFDLEAGSQVSDNLTSPLIPEHREQFGAPGPNDSAGHRAPPTQSLGKPLVDIVPAPHAIINSVATANRPHEHQQWTEFDSLTYTAVTVDPEDFTIANGYMLRPRLFARPRQIEILVGITVYSEDKTLLCRTLHSVVRNIESLRARTASKTWGRDSWKKVVVCILVDGMETVDPGVLDVLETVGVYQDGICRKRTSDGAEVKGHLFEFTSQISVTEKMTLVRPNPGQDSGSPPVQLVFFLKARNCGKLNSYRWLYHAFAGVLDPNIVVHVDVGTKLDPSALIALWEEFDLEPRLAGSCGELVCSIDGDWRNLLNPLVAAQNFEYKVGFQLDRTFESATGYLSVLPGAFSAYRHAGNQGAPLDDTLIGDPTWVDAHDRDPKSQSPVNLNRYLADDRAICFQLVSKSNTHWILKYCGRAKATTDIPTTTTDFVNQRRRWLNGAFFSTIYVLKNMKALSRSDNSLFRKIAFYIQVMHGTLALVLAWFSLAAFLLATFTINSISGEPPAEDQIGGFPFGKATPAVNAVIQIVYMATIVIQFILALGSRPRNHRVCYVISFFIFGIIQVYFIMNIIYLIKRVVDLRADNTGASNYAYIGEFYADLGPATIIVSAFSVFGVYVLAALLARDPWHLVTSFAQFLFISSSYVNILNIYAFSNTHDVSWGQKSRFREPVLGNQRPNAVEPAAIERRYTFTDQNLELRPSTDSEFLNSVHSLEVRYQAAVRRALSPEPRNRSVERPKVLAVADKLMEFRTILVASYIFSNFFICLIVLNDSLKILWWLGDSYWHKIWFFRIWLWANSISFLIRLVGCVWYYALRLYRGM